MGFLNHQIPRILIMALALVAIIYGNSQLSKLFDDTATPNLIFPKVNQTLFLRRKLLGYEGATNRIGNSCSKNDIVIFQGPSTPLPNGIPTYTVQVLNVCVSRCSIYNIHVGCGWFSSARLINPKVFRRILFNDCLVNDGAAIGPGESLSFQYANSFRYPLYVSSVSC